MVNDIVPELYENIRNDFEAALKTDPAVMEFEKRMKKGTARMQDVSEYAGNVGECALESLRSNLKAGNLPDGTLYWNISERTVKPILELVHAMINEAAKAVQTKEDEKRRIGIKPVAAPFPGERVRAFMNALAAGQEEPGPEEDK